MQADATTFILPVPLLPVSILAILAGVLAPPPAQAAPAAPPCRRSAGSAALICALPLLLH